MEISLIRHGRSRHIDHTRTAAKEFRHWVEQYDSNGVFVENQYPEFTRNKISAASLVITSDLKRSAESAVLLAPKADIISDACFRETELPALRNIPWLKLSPNVWLVLARCLWFAGYSRQCESKESAKQRAKQAAEQLIGYAQKHQSVALVGHGFFNRFIAEELQKKGWKGKRKSNAKHWHCTTYTLTH